MRKVSLALLIVFPLITASLCGRANMNSIHEESKDSANRNIDIVGQTPSPELASKCDTHFLENNLGAKIRASYKRTADYKTYLPWTTTQTLIHRGSPELGKKLISY